MPIDLLFDLLGMLFDGDGDDLASAVSRSLDQRRLAEARRRRSERWRAQIASCPLLPISGAPDGPAAFQGRARQLALMRSPLSGRPVIGYRLRLEGSFEEDGQTARRTLLDVSSVGEFEIAESEHRVRVMPARCVPLLAPEPDVRLELAAVVKPPLAEIVDRACVPASELASATELRAVEHLLEPGEPVFAFGVARKQPDPDGTPQGYRDTPWQRTLTSPPDGVLIVADQHRDLLLEVLERQWDILPPG